MLHYKDCQYGCGYSIKSCTNDILRESNIQYDEDKIEDNKDVYGFAYLEDERAINLFCKPVKGQIVGSMFYEYKKNGSLKKNGVGIGARIYADTYEETVEGFNALVSARIEKLEEEISKVEDLFIE